MASSDVELRAVATLPEEDPSPVLRLASNGTISYSNRAGKAILQAWDCEVGGPAPQVWREIVKEVLVKNANRVIELEYGPVVYSFSVVPIPELGHVNLYVNDVTERKMIVKALTESEERFRVMADNMEETVWLLDMNLNFVYVSPSDTRLRGYTLEELNRIPMDKQLAPESFKKAMEAAATFLSDPASFMKGSSRQVILELETFRKDGSTYWSESTYTLITDAAGSPSNILVVGRDVTERRRVLSALRESEERYRELVEQATCIILKTDFAGRIVSFNEYAKAFFGYDREELLGKSIFATIAPKMESTGRDLTKLMADVVAHPELFRTNIKGNAKKSEERVWIQWNNSVVKDEQGRPTGVICIGTDITERMRTEEALAESEARFRTSFESAATGMAMTGTDNRFIKVNRAMCAILGYSEDELLGRSLLEVTFPEDRPKSEELLRKLFRREVQELHYEKRYLHRDGHVVWGNVSSAAVRGPDGEALYYFTQVEDITARKLAEEELEMYSNRLEELVEMRTAELEETHRVLVGIEGLAAIGRVSTQLAHDLRNPLAAIKTEAYVLGELLPKSLDTRARDTLRLLSDSVDHAGKVIEDLLEYTRVQEPRRQPLELGACVADVVAAFPMPKAVSLAVKKGPEVYVLAERAQMAKVIRSLLYNAVEAMPHGGRLIVSFELKGGFVSFSLADTGVGIDKADLPKVFLPFYSTKAKGLGLGLNIARRIVETIGGSMELKSTRGKGTKVTVMLPIVSETRG